MKTSIHHRISALLAGVLLVMPLAGCISIGRPFATQGVKSLTIGKANQSDVELIFGKPFRTGLQDGDVTWTFVNYKLRVFGPQCTQDLVVRFAPDGTVKSYAYNTSPEENCPKIN